MRAERLLEKEVSVPEAIVRVLEEVGIDFVFGMPGGNTLLIFDALYDHRSTIRTVLVRDESLAGVMAEVYGRLTGKPGVALGQGAFMLANSFLGVLEAHLGCSPMLLLCDLSDNAPYSHHAPYQSGTGEYGTWDAKQSFSGVTKLTMTPHEPAQAVQHTQLAIKHALTGERGPVAVLYHSSSLKGLVGPESRPFLYSTKPYLLTNQPFLPDEDKVEAAAKALSQAKQPVIIAGNGIRISKGYRELQDLAELLGAPVTTTASGKGVFPETHDLSLGVYGNFGLPLANAWISGADVVLVIGSKLSSTDTISENPKLLDPLRQRIIQIDIEPKNAGWTFPCEDVIIADASNAMTSLTSVLRERGSPSEEIMTERKNRLEKGHKTFGYFNSPVFISNEVPILPQRIVSEIQKVVPQDAFIACDAGENRLFMNHYYQTKRAGTFIQPASIGGMGYAIPAALAARLLDPNRQAVAVCGDGGFTISMNGLITAYEEKIPIVVVVFNNLSLGWVKHGQKGRLIASELGNIDHAAIARAIGCQGIRVEDPGDLKQALDRALASREPTVVDVVTALKPSYEDVMSPLANPLWETMERNK